MDIHPWYSRLTLAYDLAILTLKHKLTLGDTVKPIHLADSNAVMHRGLMLNVSGWGATEHDKGGSKELLYATVAYIETEFCQTAYEAMQIVIDESMFCAGVEGVGGTDTCSGDSGGPIVADNVQYGVVSFGYRCALPDFPGVYASVANSRKWIFEITGV